MSSMIANVKWVDGAMFLGEAGSGHCVVMDGPEDHGGRNVGVRPMELVLIGMGGCASFDVVSILKKSRQKVSGCQALLEAERAEAVPAVFTSIKVHFVITGHELKENQVKRAVALSAEKYCSASIMLGRGGVIIEHSYEIVEQADN
jgi:putative redox protein